MPIYDYKCESCGHRQDVLQKLSDPLLTQCPACQAASFVKQVTAAGFQLKGSGWYVTDFRDGGKKPAVGESGGDAKGDAADKSGKADPAAAPSVDASDKASASPAPAPAPAPAPTAAAPASAPAPGPSA